MRSLRDWACAEGVEAKVRANCGRSWGVSNSYEGEIVCSELTLRAS